MLFSIGLIFIFGLFFSKITDFLKLPDVVGYIFAGILLNFCGVLHADISLVSTSLQSTALVIILLRAGLSLDIKKLKSIGLPVVLMSTVPAILEIIMLTLISIFIFDVPTQTALIIGATVSAVSPAIIVPRMIKLQSTHKNSTIPELILSSASLDDILVIVLFYSFTQNTSIALLPLNLIFGTLIGALLAISLVFVLKRTVIRANVTVALLLSFSFIMLHVESFAPFSALLATLVLGIVFRKKMGYLSMKISSKLDDLWSAFSILLFVLLGFSLNIETALSFGFTPIILVILGLFARTFGVFLSLAFSNFTFKEKLFCAISFLPKATVQAGLGGIPLALGLPYGDLILTISVISILISAPLGAILIDNTQNTLLTKD